MKSPIFLTAFFAVAASAAAFAQTTASQDANPIQELAPPQIGGPTPDQVYRGRRGPPRYYPEIKFPAATREQGGSAFDPTDAARQCAGYARLMGGAEYTLAVKKNAEGFSVDCRLQKKPE